MPLKTTIQAEQRRQRLLEAIHARPGASVRELARIIGTDNQTAGFHIHYLARQGLVVALHHGRHVLVFPKGTDTAAAQAIIDTSDPQLQQLRSWIEVAEHVSQIDVIAHAAVEWQWSRTTTRDRLQRLVASGAILREQASQKGVYYTVAACSIQAHLDTLASSPAQAAHP